MKKQSFSTPFVAFLILALILPTTQAAQAQVAQSINVGAPSLRQSIIYKEPAVDGVQMADASVVSHFEMLIYSRSLLKIYLPRYEQLGWNGLSLLYLDVSKNNGPAGLSSLTAQKTLCTDAQQRVDVYSNSITMDTGEMCRIHDAIINKTQVDGLTVTEAWFLHRSDGSRYQESGGGAAQYRMNLANPDYQKYYVNKLRREFSAVDPAHLPTGAQGVFFDNLNLAWPHLVSFGGGNPPKEFADRFAYQHGIESFLSVVRTELPNIKIWGNMTSFSTNTENFTDFKPYMDGAMIEGAFLDWDGAPRAVDEIENGNAVADAWEKPLLYVVQGDVDGTYHTFSFGLYMLMENDDAYFFFTDRNSYANYHEITQYKLALGNPLGARQLVSPGVWKRQFEYGQVQVDINTHTATFSVVPTELLQNRSFSLYVGTSKVPKMWTAAKFGLKDGKDTAAFKDGPAAVKMSGAASTNKSLTQTLSVGGFGGDAFSFSVWVKGLSVPTAGLCRAQVFLYNGSTIVSVKTVNCPVGTFAFRKLSLNFMAPGDYTKIQVKLTYAKAGGTIWFDTLSLLK